MERSDPPERAEREELDLLVDEESLESFPASDPPSWWAAPPDRPARGAENRPGEREEPG